MRRISHAIPYEFSRYFDICNARLLEIIGFRVNERNYRNAWREGAD